MMKRILQVVWTGTGWDLLEPLLDHQLLPTFARLYNSGMRAQLNGLQPQVAIQLSHSVLTGQPAWIHGLAHPLKVDDRDQIGCNTIYDATEVGLPGWLASAKQCGLWIGWPHLMPGSVTGQHIVHRGFACGSANDHEDQALNDCTLGAEEINLDQLRPFFPELDPQEILDDPITFDLRKALAQAGTLQACATRLMQRTDWQFASVRFELGNQVVRRVGDCHPPLEHTVDVNRLLRYQHMVTGAYRLMDMMLARLIELAGPQTTVVIHSDTGTARGVSTADGSAPMHQVFRAAHDDRGFLLLAGEDITPHHPLFAASILDIAPTLAMLSGLHVDGLQGRVLSEAVSATAPMETVIAADAAFDSHAASGEPDSNLMEDLLANGECQAIADQDPAGIKEESDFFMALNMMQNGAAGHALKLLEKLCRQKPNERRYMLHRARCHLILGQLDPAQNWTEKFCSSGETDLHAHLLKGRIALLQDETDQALVHFFQAEQMRPDDAISHCQIGDAYRRAEKYEQAQDAFQRALELDPLLVDAHLGQARIALAHERYEDACDSCLKALESDYRHPDVHFHLGVALAKTDKVKESIVAFETCLRLAPSRKAAHQWLASLYRFVDGGLGEAAMHKALSLRDSG